MYDILLLCYTLLQFLLTIECVIHSITKKKQNTFDLSKMPKHKELNQNKNKLITQYFNVNKNKNETIERTEENALKVFYKNCVDEHLNKQTTSETICMNRMCVEKKQNLNAELNSLNLQFQRVEKAYITAIDVAKKKDERIQELQNLQLKSKSVDRIEICSNRFTAKDIILLQSVGPSKEKDSSYVLLCVESLYREDLSVLIGLSVTGGRNTKSMSSEDFNILNEMFENRLVRLNLDPDEKNDRRTKFKKHLLNAISNIAKRKMN